MFRLSRANTNVHAEALSVHEKYEATLACQSALEALLGVVRDSPSPTR